MAARIENSKDALLIAAAPDLLAALEASQGLIKVFLRMLDRRDLLNENLADDINETQRLMEAALAKAGEGGAS